MAGLEYLQTEQSKRVLRIIRIIMQFTHRIVRDLDDGIMSYADGTSTDDYSEFPLPNELKSYMIKTLIALKPSYLVDVYLSVLTKPDRIDTLIDAFMKAFIAQGHLYTDADFVLYTIMCCLISVELYKRGFREAKDIAVETVRGLCSLHNKYDSFRKYNFII